jgi:predicted nucleic-acid-binding protein
MIAIDTNVVLRYVLNDDKEQARKAAALIRRHKEVLITDVVLAEMVWTLKGRRYKLDRSGICKVVNALFAEPSIRFEDNQVVWRALSDFAGATGLPDVPKSKGTKTSIDFADALIVNKARWCAAQAGGALEAVYTFDGDAVKLAGVKRP